MAVNTTGPEYSINGTETTLRYVSTRDGGAAENEDIIVGGAVKAVEIVNDAGARLSSRGQAIPNVTVSASTPSAGFTRVRLGSGLFASAGDVVVTEIIQGPTY